MTIKKHGGIFGRNPTYYNVEVENDLRVGGDLIINGETVTGLDFEGSWDASTNTPDVTASPTVGQFWIVSVAGNTDLSGITTWDVGDWALYDGSAWQRVEGGGNGTFTKVNVDNLQLDGNGIISTDANGNIGLVPNGTGSLLIGSNDQASYVAAKIRKKFNGSVSVQFDGGGTAIYADLSMDANENLSLRLDPDSSLSDQTFSITHDGSAIAQFIGSSGDVKVNQGNLVIGTSGKGIDFSATAGTGTSELLNDYEEGNWTPAYDTTGTAFDSATYDYQLGRYTKIGNMVYVQGTIRNDTLVKGSATGSIKITGLPFAPYYPFFRWNAGSVGFTATFVAAPTKVHQNSSSTELVLDIDVDDMTYSATSTNINYMTFALAYRAA